MQGFTVVLVIEQVARQMVMLRLAGSSPPAIATLTAPGAEMHLQNQLTRGLLARIVVERFGINKGQPGCQLIVLDGSSGNELRRSVVTEGDSIELKFPFQH